MADLNIRNVDESLMRSLKARAAENGMTLRAWVLGHFEIPEGATIESIEIKASPPVEIVPRHHPRCGCSICRPL